MTDTPKPEMNAAQEAVLALITAGTPPVFEKGPDAPEGLVKIHHGSLMKTLHGHSATILRVVFSNDGRLLATSSYDQSVKVWDTHVSPPPGHIHGTPVPYDQADDKPLWTFQVNAVHPNMAFFKDNKFLLTSARDGHMKIWDLATAKCVSTSQVLPIFQKDIDELTIPNIHSQAFNKDCDTMMTLQGSHLKRFDVRTGKLKGYYKDPKELRMRNMAISGDGRFCVISGERKTPGVKPPSPLGTVTPYVGIWNLEGAMAVERIEVDPDGMFLAKKAVAIKCIDISETGDLFALATGSPRDNTASVWSVKKAERLVTLIHSGTVWSLKFAHESHWLITGGSDTHDRVRIWDWRRGHCLGHLSAGTGGAMCLAMTTNQHDHTRVLAVGHQHGIIRLWDMSRLSRGIFRMRLGLVYLRELMEKGRADLKPLRQPKWLKLADAQNPELAVLPPPAQAPATPQLELQPQTLTVHQTGKALTKKQAKDAAKAARMRAQLARKAEKERLAREEEHRQMVLAREEDHRQMVLARQEKWDDLKHVMGSLDFSTAAAPLPVFKLIISFVDKVTAVVD